MTSTWPVTEDELQRQVVDWLQLALPPGCVFHHSPNEGTRHVAFKQKLKRLGTRFGWPDLEIFCPGKPPVFIELKVGKNTITAAQNKTLQALSTAGCVTAVCRNLDDVRQVLGTVVQMKDHSQTDSFLFQARRNIYGS